MPAPAPTALTIAASPAAHRRAAAACRLLVRHTRLPQARQAGRRALCRDRARDGAKRRFRHAAPQRHQVLREAGAAIRGHGDEFPPLRRARLERPPEAGADWILRPALHGLLRLTPLWRAGSHRHRRRAALGLADQRPERKSVPSRRGSASPATVDRCACSTPAPRRCSPPCASPAIGPGDEVITTPLSWVATTNVIVEVGARPVFVDVEARTRNIDPERIAAAIGPRTRALMPVDLAGLPAARAPIYELAQAHGLRVIEDAAQSFSASDEGRPIGTTGDFVAFSFHANENVTCGEGGALVLLPDVDPVLTAAPAGRRAFRRWQPGCRHAGRQIQPDRHRRDHRSGAVTASGRKPALACSPVSLHEVRAPAHRVCRRRPRLRPPAGRPARALHPATVGP